MIAEQNRSPKELIQLYWEEVWNNRNADFISELCADPIIRHDPGSTTELSIADQIARVRQQSETAEPFFEHEVLHADDEYVTSVWNMHTRKGERVDLCGIEVFRAQNGKFTHCWNSSYVAGRWGRDGDRSVPDNLPPPQLIGSSNDITSDWIQQVFQAADIDVPRVSLVSCAPIGHGNLSETVKVQITYNANAANAAQSVIAKLTSQIPAALNIAIGQNVYHREVEVYRLLGESPPVNVPRAYLMNVGAEGAALNLVLEDLSEKTTAGSQIEGCTLEEADATIRELAKLHCHYWNDASLKGSDWLLGRGGSAAETQAIYAEGASIFRDRFTGRLAGEDLDLMDQFTPHVKRWVLEKIQSHTLIHGELRVDNVLFEKQPDGIKAWFIDWQFTDLGSPMFDAAYFLAGSLTIENRRACEAELVHLHQAEIEKIDPGYTLDQARQEYADALPFALFTTVGAALAVPPGEHEDELLMTLFRRNLDAIRYNKIVI